MNRFCTLTFSLIIALFQVGCQSESNDSAEAASVNSSPATMEMKRAPVEGGEIEYIVQGSGEPILLIHGAHIADAYMPLMSESALSDYQLIRYRRRGYAGSSPAEGPVETYIARAAADAISLLNHLGIDHAHIAGHSSGGIIALQVAQDAPDIVKSLILLEPAIVKVPANAGPESQEFGDALYELYNAGNSSGALDLFLGGEGVIGPEWRSDLAELIPDAVEQVEADAATFFDLEFIAVGLWEHDEEKLSSMEQPVMYILGTETLPYFRENKDLLVHTWFPQTVDLEVEGVNHALFMKDPQTIAQGIADFLVGEES